MYSILIKFTGENGYEHLYNLPNEMSMGDLNDALCEKPFVLILDWNGDDYILRTDKVDGISKLKENE